MELAPTTATERTAPVFETTSGNEETAGSAKHRRLILSSALCPGDILTMTAAVESLHRQYPGAYLTDIRTPVPEIWWHNPHITPLEEGQPGVECIELNYPSIHCSNQTSARFIEGYTQDLGTRLGVTLRCHTNRPHLYLAPEERTWISQVQELTGKTMPFWLVNAGTKADYTAKQWPVEFYQEVIDRLLGQVQFVQVGHRDHDHVQLSHCIDLVGKTDHRQLIRLAWHAAGGLGPVTYLQHLCAAWEKPYVCLVGGREPATWVSGYPRQATLHTIGQLSCCRDGACWRARVVPLRDGDEKDSSLCDRPLLGMRRPVPQCMALIRPAEVVHIVERMIKFPPCGCH